MFWAPNTPAGYLRWAAYAAVLIAAILYSAGYVGDAMFRATIPPGQDEDDVGGYPFLLFVCSGAWIVLLPAASLCAGLAWWTDRKAIDLIGAILPILFGCAVIFRILP